MKKVVSVFFCFVVFLAFLLSRLVLLPQFYALIVLLLLNLSGRVKRACILFISIGARIPLVVIRLKVNFLLVVVLLVAVALVAVIRSPVIPRTVFLV